MSLQYLRFDFQTRELEYEQPVIRLYPFVCWHIGAAQSDMRFIQQMIRRVSNDPNGRWVYMGDGGECVTKTSKGDIFAQMMSPNLQMEVLCDLLSPIKSKGLFGIKGNHGNRVYKESGLSFDQTLMARLGLPYMGAGTFANMVVNRSTYDMFFHHGIDSGTTARAKISKAEAFNAYINADALFTAHSHVAVPLPPAPLLECDNANRRVRTKFRYGYICGCAYDSRTGYAEDRGYPPLLPAHIVVEFDGRITEGKAVHSQRYSAYRSSGDYDLDHSLALKYINKGDRS